MKTLEFLSLLEQNPIISAVKNDGELRHALQSDCGAIILLFGNALNVGELVSAVKEAGKACVVHVDLVEGLSQSTVAVDFLLKSTQADGVISTRPQLVRHARQQGMLSIQQRLTDFTAQYSALFHHRLQGSRQRQASASRLRRRYR